MNTIRSILKHQPLLLLLFTYVAMATFLALRLPAFAGPNEALHYEYIALVRQNGRLPDLSTSERADERHQPPVYYIAAALLSLPFEEPALDTDFTANPHYATTRQGNLNPMVNVTLIQAPVLYISRFTSMMFGIVALISIYAAARLSLPLSTSLLIVSITAFQPTFLQLSATVNNDLPVTAVGAALIAYTTYLITNAKTPRAFVLWGVLFALALLTKASAIFLLLLLPVTCWTLWRTQHTWQRALQSGLWGLIGFMPFWLGWLLYNQIRSQDALGVAPSIPIARLFGLSLADFGLLFPYVGELFRSFWLDWSPGMLGYASWWVYILWGSALLLALFGWLRPASVDAQPASIVSLHLAWIVALAGAFLAVKALMIREAGFLVPEGRWLLPALPSLAWLVGVGWARWWPPSQQARLNILATLSLPLFALSLLFLLFPVLYPRAQPLRSLDQILDSSRAVGLSYDQQIELVAIETEPLVIGKPAEMQIYWQALRSPDADFSVDVQVLHSQAGAWLPLARQSSFPGHGLDPTSGWQAGDIYRDRIALHPQGDLPGPTAALVVISLLDKEAAVAVQREEMPLDWAVVDEIVARPAAPLQVPATDKLESAINFGELFELAGFTHASKDGILTVTLWWQALDDVSADFTTFVHVLDSSNQILAQSDSLPAAGASPTRLWQAGDVIRDQHRLEVQFSSGSVLIIGAYDVNSLQRLPVTQDGQFLPDSVWRYVVP